jgi:formamidopyrimidine-DNA glycosylase
MPELPEVETVARGLRTLVVGRTITGVTVRWPRIIAFPSLVEFEQRIVGRRIQSVDRRGKFVVFLLDEGVLLIHLKMSGRLRVVPADEPEGKHAHTLFHLDNGQQCRFVDIRKFGRVYLVADASQVTGRLGPEPLDPDWKLGQFQSSLSKRSGRLKSLLLDQSFLAGLGNIYADEALFAARLHPLRTAKSLTPEEQERLFVAIRQVLGRAVAGRGTTLDDQGYVDVGGEAGTFQGQIAVYGRKGAPCRVCATPVERIVVGARSTHFCPACQR